MWSFGRAWRDIQRSWGIDPGPEPEAMPAPPRVAAPAAGEGAARRAAQDGGVAAARNRVGGDEQAPQPPQQRRDVRAAQRALEAGEDPLEWRELQDGRGYARGHGANEDEEDEFFLEDEGDFGGTVAIVALCMLLACVTSLFFSLCDGVRALTGSGTRGAAGSCTSDSAPSTRLVIPPRRSPQPHPPRSPALLSSRIRRRRRYRHRRRRSLCRQCRAAARTNGSADATRGRVSERAGRVARRFLAAAAVATSQIVCLELKLARESCVHARSWLCCASATPPGGLLLPLTQSASSTPRAREMDGAADGPPHPPEGSSLLLETALLSCVRLALFIACRHYVNLSLFSDLRNVIREDGLVTDLDSPDDGAIELEDAEDGYFGLSAGGGGAAAGASSGGKGARERQEGLGQAAAGLVTGRRGLSWEGGRRGLSLSGAAGAGGTAVAGRAYTRLSTALFCLSFSESGMLFTLLLFGDAVSARCVPRPPFLPPTQADPSLPSYPALATSIGPSACSPFSASSSSSYPSACASSSRTARDPTSPALSSSLSPRSPSTSLSSIALGPSLPRSTSSRVHTPLVRSLFRAAPAGDEAHLPFVDRPCQRAPLAHLRARRGAYCDAVRWRCGQHGVGGV